MLQTFWYLVLYGVFMVSSQNSVTPGSLKAEVFVASKPVYTVGLKGTFTQGSLVDLEAKKGLGDFETTKRMPQGFSVFPAVALKEEFAAAGKKADAAASGASGSSSSSATAAKSQTAAAADTKKPDLGPFVIDLSDVIKASKLLNVQTLQTIPFPQAAEFKAKEDASSKDSGSGSGAASTQAGAKAGAGNTAASSTTDKKEADTLLVRNGVRRMTVSFPADDILILFTW